jgi:hypothetical protein
MLRCMQAAVLLLCLPLTTLSVCHPSLSAVVTIHMLRGDASGRSFYIRVRDDVAEANLEAATAAVPDAKRLLQQQQQRASQATTPAAVEADSGGAPRMYFWLTDRDLGRAVYSLGRLKSLLKRPPTLAKRSGVPERQLLQLGAWLQSADVAAAAQQHQRDADAASASTSAAAAAAASLLELGGEEAESGQPAAAWVERQGGFSSGVAAAARARPAPTGPLSPLQQTSGLLLGHTMSQMHGGMAALLPPPPQQAQREREGAQSGAAGSTCSSGVSAEGEAGEAGALASGTSTVSATAAALYQDQRFNVVCPCTVRCASQCSVLCALRTLQCLCWYPAWMQPGAVCRCCVLLTPSVPLPSLCPAVWWSA